MSRGSSCRRRPSLFALLALVAAALWLVPQAAEARLTDHGKTVLFHSVYIPPDEVIDGDLNVIFGDAQIAGTVHGDVNTIFGQCTKLEGAVIDGQENCVTDSAVRELAPWIAGSSALHHFAAQDKRMIVRLGANAIVLLFFLLFPLRMRMALDHVERHPGWTALVGAVVVMAIVPVALVLLISILGIPLIVVEAAALLGGVWLGTGAVALLIGRRLSELVLPNLTPSPLWALVLGLVVVSAAETVPVVGWAVTALVWLVGLGASVLSFIGSVPLATPRRPRSNVPMGSRSF